MIITNNHKVFYAEIKLNLKKTISVHRLINEQVKMSQKERETYCDKVNDLNFLNMLINRCKRNDWDLKAEIFEEEISSTGNRARLLRKVRKGLIK